MVCLPTAPRRRTKAPLKVAVPVPNHEFSQVVLPLLKRFASVALETHSERDGIHRPMQLQLVGKLSPGEDDHPKASALSTVIRSASDALRCLSRWSEPLYSIPVPLAGAYTSISKYPAFARYLNSLGTSTRWLSSILAYPQPSLGTFCYDHDCGGRLHGRPRAIVHALEHGGRTYSPLTRSVLIDRKSVV